MIKKTVLLSLASFLLISVAFGQQSPKVATVNMQELFTNYWKVKASESKFQSSAKNAEELILDTQEEGRALQKELEELDKTSKNPVLTEEARQAALAELQQRLPELQKKQQEFNAQRQAAQQNLARQRQQIIAQHAEEIKNVVSSVAKEVGADLVLNEANEAIPYVAPAFSITQKVLDVLNADKPADME